MPGGAPGADAKSVGKRGQPHFVHAVAFFQKHVDLFGARGIDAAPHIIGMNGQFAVTSVHQHQKLHPVGAAVIKDALQGGPYGAPGVQHIVHQNDLSPFQRKGDGRSAQGGHGGQ